MRAVIVASADMAPTDRRWLDEADLVIAADGGAGTLEALGTRPDLLVGDLDSADPRLVERLEAGGTRVERHPADKDASDTELALEAAIGGGASEVVVLGAVGGLRLDHELANLLLLADPALDRVEVRLVHGPTTVRVARGGDVVALEGRLGDLVSLLPIGGSATGVSTVGLRWPLATASLDMGRSRGLSNEITESSATVTLESGTLLVIETEIERKDS